MSTEVDNDEAKDTPLRTQDQPENGSKMFYENFRVGLRAKESRVGRKAS